MNIIHNNITQQSDFYNTFSSRTSISIINIVSILGLAIIGLISYVYMRRKSSLNKKADIHSTIPLNRNSKNLATNTKIAKYKNTDPLVPDIQNIKSTTKDHTSNKSDIIKKNDYSSIESDKSNSKKFKLIFSSFFDTPLDSEIPKRREDLADLLEIGREIQMSDKQVKGAFGSWTTTVRNWSQQFPDEIWLQEKDKLYNGKQLFELISSIPGWVGTIELDTPLELDLETNLLTFKNEDDDGKKYAILALPLSDYVHNIGIFFDPVKKKYILCDNMKNPVELPVSKKLCNFKNLHNFNRSIETQGHIAMDMDNVHLILDKSDWEGLNWVMPRWKDYNCYLSLASMWTMYLSKMREILVKNVKK